MLAMNFNRLKWKGRGCMNQTAFSMWLWMNDLWRIQCTLHQPCTLVSQARPNQPQRGSLSVSPCVILKAIRAGVGWVWLARLPCTQGLRLLPCRGGALGPDTRYVTCGDVRTFRTVAVSLFPHQIRHHNRTHPTRGPVTWCSTSSS